MTGTGFALTRALAPGRARKNDSSYKRVSGEEKIPSEDLRKEFGYSKTRILIGEVSHGAAADVRSLRQTEGSRRAALRRAGKDRAPRSSLADSLLSRADSVVLIYLPRAQRSTNRAN